MNKRGCFIVFEGIDRSGKTTQAKLLNSVLSNSEYVRFPNRDTTTGKIINAYLKGSIDMSPQVNHLLFSANRWECMKDIQTKLHSGIDVICDRYSYSGIAYSMAKGLSYSWCSMPDEGLLKPDLIFYLIASPEVVSDRGEYGKERFENVEFQTKVQHAYENYLFRDSWVMIDATQSVQEVHDIIMEVINERK